MKIAHIVPYSIVFPLQVHNGRYDWVLQLVAMQVSAGHEVTVYCNPKSNIAEAAVASITDPTSEKDVNNERLLRFAFSQEHDIYHSHFDNLHYKFATETSSPIVYTQHYPPDDELVRISRLYPASNVWAVPPTKFMLGIDRHLGLQSKGHIYHGVNLKEFTRTKSQKNNRLLFVGRITPYKRIEVAIKVAHLTGMGLDIVGKVADKEASYWKSIVDTIDDREVVFHGPKSKKELATYFSQSSALIFPSVPEDEAFGLVVIESQACGTPVITAKGGARHELIEDGRTGYLCNTIEDYVRAVKELGELDNNACRLFAEQFSNTRMFQRYEELYISLL